jgi:acetylornithine deacetylase/succinyl-diaminopimelate desuccinylase-like protein
LNGKKKKKEEEEFTGLQSTSNTEDQGLLFAWLLPVDKSVVDGPARCFTVIAYFLPDEEASGAGGQTYSVSRETARADYLFFPSTREGLLCRTFP